MKRTCGNAPIADKKIRIYGARQNNLKNLSLELPLNEIIVITGVSGSGKSSLAFDTVYSEGQRRYIETFSPYARQFLDRMDKPRADRIEGIPPAIAIDQTNPVRTSRSTVGTMTELNDHLKLLYARAARLECPGCHRVVRRDTPDAIYRDLQHLARDADRVLITFPVRIPPRFSEVEILDALTRQGYTRIHARREDQLEVLQDRVRWAPGRRGRIVEALETALRHEAGQVFVRFVNAGGDVSERIGFSSALHCADCDTAFRDPTPNLFSFNSAIGACETCRGFGRTIGVDYALVIPDASLSLADGAVKPWQTPSYRECQADLLRFARKRSIPVDVPWSELTDDQRRWVIDGEGEWDEGKWYGARRFFDWLEGRSYKMHIRVLLSKYRAYHLCPACEGARLKPEALHWKLGAPGLAIDQLLQLPLARSKTFFDALELPAPLDQATDILLGEIRTRLRYLMDVGLGYLTLDRQSRTLSGGEVQRINLTTALGTSLVNTLFVLDEPSIGLHPRDIGRLVQVLRRLRDAGNSLVVVEHDPDVIRAADRVIDLGPGPGERGGRITYEGSVAGLLAAKDSLTGRYMSGEVKVTADRRRRAEAPAAVLEIEGAAAHNLKEIGVRLPLNRLVCITGVSGSGKSTLVQEVCYRALCKALHRPVEAPGPYRAIRGHEGLSDVVLVDQSPIGKTTRSNPASYVGAFDAIRNIFAAQPEARGRGFTAGAFSFNAGNGRCTTCGGKGFEHVEMQFLSDIYLRCPDCNGTRYRAEILEVAFEGHSIADVLDLTVAAACELFARYPKVAEALAPLRAVGLGYVCLGQPVPTLSGGEAQRLKLAGHLARARGLAPGPARKKGATHEAGGRTLFLFDEPTTGLHFSDIARLLGALDALIEQGHSVVVIEHNLDVIRAADWIVDLGPEGGEAGGRIVCEGTPKAVAACRESHTGAALRRRRRKPQARAATKPGGPADGCIWIHKAREHNLRNVEAMIPRDAFTVITGISGSGKSTLAFDILFAEGQRRYLESLNAYARQFVETASRPDVDAVYGIPPTVAIEQRTSRGGRKSTVATVTEIWHFFRLLFMKLGTPHCPDCGVPIQPQSADAIHAAIRREFKGRRVHLLAPLVVSRKGIYKDLARWAAARGITELRVDGAWLPTEPWPKLDRYREHDIEWPVAELRVGARMQTALREPLDRALDAGKGRVHVRPVDADPDAAPRVFSTRRACTGCGRGFEEPDPRLFSYNSKHGWCPACFGTGLLMEGFDEEQTGEEPGWNERVDGGEPVCPACRGQRLNREALSVRFRDRSIADLAGLSVADAARFFKGLRTRGREAAVAADILAEVTARLCFLDHVGLSYLELGRAAPTLSGGEAQRIRLAAQLGSNLRGVCYVLDEPTIGLHPRDNTMLLDTLRHLQGKGNTVVVVEHDEQTIRRAEHLIDLGPRAGKQGGRIVAEGTVKALMATPDSVTGRFLKSPPRHPLRPHLPVDATTPRLDVKGACAHNLKAVDAVFPLGRFTCVTGVSGSGKSTLVHDVLYAGVQGRVGARRRRNRQPPGAGAVGCRTIDGVEQVKRVMEVDQTPIGKTPRSCPATYVGFWAEVRRLFASAPESRMRGYGPSRFSFNVTGGRCEECAGQGVKRIEMSFLPNVSVPCESCGGRRFTEETLSVRYKDQSIADVLEMDVDEAAAFFEAHEGIGHALGLLREVGLGYLTLGQPSPTLSGGEAQRIKLVAELARTRTDESGRRKVSPHTLYILDEPTIGLHVADVEKLIRVLRRLTEGGHSVVVIEHNLDVIAEADWVIDLGPEGGGGGGRIVVQGPPAAVRRSRRSHTGAYLRELQAERSGPGRS